MLLIINLQQLDEKKQDSVLNEALRQVALADILLLNKIDLVTEKQLDDVSKRIR